MDRRSKVSVKGVDSVPKVSVVLPVYNGARYLKESIDSILSQSFSDWELIIVDDCSTDLSLQIANEYAENDERISVIHNTVNCKLPKSLNIGFQQAKGEFLTWTSDDNRYLPNAIERMAEFLDTHSDIYLVSASMNTMDDDGRIIGEIYSYDEPSFYYWNSVGACFMYRHDVLREIGGYDPDFFLAEDYEYWFRIFFHYGSIGKIDDVLYVYRIHSQSLSATREEEVHRQLIRLRNKYIDDILVGKCCKDYICRVYYEFMEMQTDISQYKQKFLARVPELSLDVGMDIDKPIIVYGAGDYGSRAYNLIGERIEYYADKDPHKHGQFKHGKKILSLSEISQMQDEYQILIAVSIQTVYDVLSDFCQNGIKKCCVYQNVICNV